MKIRSKISISVAVGTITLALSLAVISFLSFRSTSLENEHEHGELASELTRNELMISFMQGSFDHDKLEAHVKTHIPDLHEIRIVRAKAAEDQFGKGEHTPNDAEREAILKGSSTEQLIETVNGVKYQFITPFYADQSCLQCHKVSVGTLLGLVNVELDLTSQRADAMATAYTLIIFLILFSIILGFALRRMIMPIVDTTQKMQMVVAKAEHGDFSGRLDDKRTDELGEMAKETNQLMQTLEDSFGTIVNHVESMEVYRHIGSNNNLLLRTIESVKSMVDAARFKQTIEDDRNLEDVYSRISDILEGHFQLNRFSMYEVNQDKHQMSLVFSKGIPEGSELWCSLEIKVDNSVCRACRTAQDIDSTIEKHLCPAFTGNDQQLENHLFHFCIPLIMGGKVGGVLQVVYPEEERKAVHAILPSVRTYLTEAAPVIESKRLNKIMHESTLRDPMTGLFNRRFLEEFESRLIATVERRKSTVALLMCDIDYFKETNDTHGHQVGDQVLITMSQIMGKSVRQSDYIIRMGGEEFLVILMDTHEDKVAETAERIRSDLEAHVFKTPSGSFTKTMSIGVDIFNGEGDSLTECIHHADLALYHAKEGGRNRVVRYEHGKNDSKK